MAYDSYNAAKPTGADDLVLIPDSARINDNALRDMVGFMQAVGFVFEVSGGSNEEPAYYYLKNGTTWLRGTTEWTSGKLTKLSWHKSLDSNNGPWDAMLGGDQVLGYDGSGNLTSTTNAGGLASLLWYVIAKVKALLTNFNTHKDYTGTQAHGLGDMSLQNKASVDITGGNAVVTKIQYDYARGKVTAWGNVSGSKEINWAASDTYTGTITGVTTFTDANLPGSGLSASVTLKLTNPGAYTVNWPTAWDWPAGTAPARTASGVDIYEAFCDGSAVVNAVRAQQDSR